MNHKFIDKPSEKVFIVGSYIKTESQDTFLQLVEETILLCKTANLNVVDSFTQALSHNKSDTYIGKGKLEEIRELCFSNDIKTLVFVDNLTPAQAKNISEATKANVVDRTELILSIFAMHARTNAAKIQVELAQLEYSYSKLRNLWQHFSRIAGGLGTKGPGEKQLEIDRRLVKKRISFLKKKLSKIKTVSSVQRKKRKDFFRIALVGYTNAGKSTLFNVLTKSDIYVADELFATLDSKSQFLYSEAGKVVLTDTVGFIKNLPTTLISSFHSTLSDVIDADLLLHVVDVSQIRADDRIADVETVIKDIGASSIPTVMVFNKVDKIESVASMFLRKSLNIKYPNSVFISAKDKTNVDTINEIIKKVLRDNKSDTNILVPVEMVSLISFLEKKYNVSEKIYIEKEKSFKYSLDIPDTDIESVKSQISKFNEMKFINS